LQRSETVGERNERLCVFFVHCLSHTFLGRGQRADARRPSQVRMDVRDLCVRTRTTSQDERVSETVVKLVVTLCFTLDITGSAVPSTEPQDLMKNGQLIRQPPGERQLILGTGH